ncbi:unnamed protein product [Echinostoma caproni]|uniref:EF-hand domain-containing protein n=1 Tax=Echinostoma caproni TaxID=27848 RepID=A0A183ACY6_9TREM|nr:unnamed protein product [Echinostoma caproni]
MAGLQEIVTKVMEAVDADGDGKISKEEFLKCCKTEQERKELLALFEKFDSDGSETIDAKELLKMVEAERAK